MRILRFRLSRQVSCGTCALMVDGRCERTGHAVRASWLCRGWRPNGPLAVLALAVLLARNLLLGGAGTLSLLVAAGVLR